MPPTTFVDGDPSTGTMGTVVDAAFLNSIYNTDGGHVHDGGSADGHAPLINLSSNVTNLLAPDLASVRRYAFFYRC